MSRDKQNEYYELERLLRVRRIDIEKQGCDFYSLLHKTETEEQSLARYLIDCGYCKASNLAEEIFAAIEEIIDKHYNKHIFNSDLEDTEIEAVVDFSDDVTYDIAKLKKKYTKSESEEEGK